MAGLDLKDLARRGAVARLEELASERAALLREFPDLRGVGGGTREGVAHAAPARSRPRRAMSAAEKRAVSARMKKYWAARRKTKATAAARS